MQLEPLFAITVSHLHSAIFSDAYMHLPSLLCKCSTTPRPTEGCIDHDLHVREMTHTASTTRKHSHRSSPRSRIRCITPNIRWYGASSPEPDADPIARPLHGIDTTAHGVEVVAIGEGTVGAVIASTVGGGLVADVLDDVGAALGSGDCAARGCRKFAKALTLH